METTVKYAVARLCNAVKFRTLHLLCKPLIVLLFLLYGGFFFGCSTENEIGNSRKSPSDLISLSGETRTRASIADLSTMESDANGFTVFGTLGNTPTQWYTDVHGNVLDGVNRHKYISGIWRFAPDVYWPVSGYPITFYALYPASPTGLGAWDYGFSPFKLRAPYTVPPTASAQQDVMAGKVSTLNRPSSGEENIAFDHILTCIDFRVIAGIGTTPEIQSVQLVNIRDTRTYDFATGNWEASVTGNTSYTYYGTVVPGGSGGSTLLPLWSAAVADETTSNPFYTTTTTPTAANAHLMLMPQTSSSWVPAHGVAPTSSSGGYVSIIYRMGTGSGTTGVGTSREVGYASANQHPDHATLGGGYTGPLFVKAGFPLPGGSSQFTWQRGNGYIYHVGLGTPNSCNGMIVDEYYYNNLGNRTNLKLIEVMTEGKRVGDKLQDGEIHLTLGVQKWEDQPISTQPATTVKVTPQFVYIPHSAQTPATQTLTVLCYDALGNPDPTGSWTLSVPSSATWLTMTLHSDGVTNVGSTISGTGNATVYLVPTANTTSNLRLAELYLNNVVSNVVSTVVQDNAGGSQGTPPVGTTTYAGAFWRATQTGERIIRINMGSDPATQSVNWGSWNAFVAWTDNKWHPAFNDGVILSTDKLDASSLAARSISYSSITTPQDAEHLDSRVISHATVVGGTVGSGDFAQFRIGLQNPFSIWHPTSNPARYALVIFLYGTPTKAQKIFVRQGEGADVMATGVNAARWSVYNVTGKNGATPTDVLPDFTEYPSQAGYYKIFSTASTLYAPIGTLTLNSELDGSAIDNICPEGYKLPNSDGTNAFSSTNEMGTLIATGTESVWGYYADGFFDRRQIVGSLGSPGEPLSAVNVSTVAVAYAGRLHYNITTNASLFMPGAGGRSSSNMPLLPQNAGSSYTYWSRTHTSGTHGWVINSGKNTSAVQVQTLKAAAYSVRCVSDFCVPVTGVVLSRTPSDGAIIAGNSVLLTATVSPLHATDVVYIWQRYSANTFMWETFETTTQNTCTAIITSFGMNQFRVLASNDCGGATSAPMLISGAIPGAGGSAARVTWDAAANGGAGEYVITYEPRNAGLLF
ncbi:MAG: fimbrillin family protein, partial [Bacteroidales bacterium]|nr:fimbrillin family protein [Bacteroidales bacterium]